MAVSARKVTVSTTAVELTSTSSDNVSGQSVIVKVPSGGETIYVGGSGVTSAQGFPVVAGEFSPSLSGFGGGLYAVTASGTVDVNVLEEGV